MLIRKTGPRRGKVTIIRFCEGDATAHVTTGSANFCTKLISRGFAPYNVTADRAEFLIPKGCVMIRGQRHDREK